MDCYRVYEALVRNAKFRGKMNCYVEVHHIIPRCLNGDSSPENLVALTYREHFLAHWLLTRMFTGIEKRKMAYAFYCMTWTSLGNRIIAGWQFDLIKRLCKQQRLATAKQRREFAHAQKLHKISEIVQAAQAGKDVSSILKLDSMVRRASDGFVKNGRLKHDKILVNLLDEAGVHIDIKKSSHDERLERWKAGR